MKVVILAGGLGTRLAEETGIRPKPMVEIGNRPMLWHIMKLYATQGFNDFVVALGYRGEMIKDYFVHYRFWANNLTVSLGSGEICVHDGGCEDWTVHLLDTGANTETGGRTKRAARFVGNETFMVTYGDGVADIDLQELVAFHHSHGKLATVTAVRPPGRFGALEIEGDRVSSFAEKPQVREGRINGGFFVFEPEVAGYIQGDETPLEREPLERLASQGQLMAYCHDRFWQCMDTMRDVRLLNDLWEEGKSPWKVWE